MVLPFTYLLTYSMVQSPSWAANWFAASQEIPRISRNPKVHYRTHKCPPPVPILGQPNPVHIPTSHLLKTHPYHTQTNHYYLIHAAFFYIYIIFYFSDAGRDRAVGKRLAMGWTVQGSNPGGGRHFPQPFRTAMETTQHPIQWVLGFFPRG